MRRAPLLAPALAAGLLLSACGSDTDDAARSGSDTGAAASASSQTGGASSAAPTSPGSSGGQQGMVLQRPVATDPKPTLPATVKSQDGQQVTVKSAARIVPLGGDVSEIVFTLGLGKNVVARDISATFPEVAKLPLITGNGHQVMPEPILRQRPTLVIGDQGDRQSGLVKNLRAAKVPVVLLPPATSVDDAPKRIRDVAAALGVPGEGRTLSNRTQKQISAAKATVPTSGTKPLVAFLYVRGTKVQMIGGRGSGADAMIKAAGGRDAGAESGINGFKPLSSEALVKAKPDVLLLLGKGMQSVGGKQGVLKLPGVKLTPAGKNGRVVAMDDLQLTSFGPRTGATLRTLATQLKAAR